MIVILTARHAFQYSDEPVPTNENLFSLTVLRVDVHTAGIHTEQGGGSFHRRCLMLFDTVFVLAAAIIIARNLFAKQGKIGVSLLAIGLSALLTAFLAPYYTGFVKLPNQGLATVVYYVISYLLFYVLIAVPAIILSSVIKMAVVGLLLGLVAHLLPTSLSSALTYGSRVYPLMSPLFARLPPINAQALGNWLRGLLPGKQ